MRILENTHIDFLGKRKTFYIASLILFVLGIGSLAIRGLELGIDFLGGSEIVLQFEEPVEISDMREKVSQMGLGNIEVKTFGDATGALIRTELQTIPATLYPNVKKYIEDVMAESYPDANPTVTDSTESSITYRFANPEMTDKAIKALSMHGFQASRFSEDMDNVDMIVHIGIADWIKENLKTEIPDNHFQVLREDRVGPKIGSELKADALIAIFFSLVIILIYLGFRFKFIFAMGAVAALFHDVLITVGMFSLLYGCFPFINLEVDLTVVAAFLTLVGYSINDTVVVFDRVRELLKLHKTEDLTKLINLSINKTISRTILTSGTSLLTIAILLIFGGEVLRAFSFTLFFGILIGTYSSIFVASALVLEYAKKQKMKLEF